MAELMVEHGAQKGQYRIMIERGALKASGELIAGFCPGKKAAVISDENVFALHGEGLRALLGAHGIAHCECIIKPGEGSKSLSRLEYLFGEFHAFGLSRKDPVIAFGGGVVGDLAGFAAATYMRGAPFIQIPTTLLAQVDSSVGGKVAVNLPQGKNLIGSFYQPRLVIADTSLLKTLPEREMKAGLAEIIKYAALEPDPSLLRLLEEGSLEENLEEIVHLCLMSKAGFVEADERDEGQRMALNFGHTFGHAIELLHGFEGINHGEAVAVGMGLAARASEKLGLCGGATRIRLLRLMDKHGLDHSCRDDIKKLIPLMAGDKKNTDGLISVMLPEQIGVVTERRLTEQELTERLTKI